MPRRRRIFVTYQPSALQESGHRKLAISISEEATNADLAREVAESVGQPAVKLEIGDGFQLRGQDTIDVILDNDVVVARPSSPRLLPVTPKKPLTTTPVELRAASILPTQPFEPGRLQISFITAELARTHARNSIKNKSEPTNAILAFNGEFISRNTTVASLKQEAARIFGWDSGKSFEDDPCHHITKGSCSCAIVQEVEQHGLFSSLHCRFTIDGTRCQNVECPYSHVRLSGLSTLPPHCSVCDEALAFPCPTCLTSAEATSKEPGAVVYCPLVQNAGCHHLHHAHCLGPRKDSTIIGCPSGCAITNVHRESLVFHNDFPGPHIVLVWDGDKVDNIPIPDSLYSNSMLPKPSHLVVLSTTEIVSLVKEFLRDRSFERGGHSLRIHARDPSTETVRFAQSTLVSVCLSSVHENKDHRRFDLFSESASINASRVPDNRDFCIDLHTAESPIVVCGCTGLKDILPSTDTIGQDPSAPMVLYVVKRRNETTEDSSSSRRRSISKESTYLASPAWQPSVGQTSRGIAAFLSSLYLFAASAGRKGAAAENKALTAMYAITRFPPAVRTLGILLRNTTPQPFEKVALSEALYHSLIDFSSRGPPAIINSPERLFETARILLAHILTSIDTKESPEMTSSPLENVSLICTISRKRLSDPVEFGSSGIVERSVGTLFSPKGELHRPEPSKLSPSISEIGDQGFRRLLSQTLDISSASIFVLRVNHIGVIHPSWSPSLESVGRDFLATIRRANETELISRGPLELKSTDVIPPQIVVDEKGLLAIFTGRGCGTTRDVNFFRPTEGGDTEVDVNDVGHALEKVIDIRKLEDTWQVDSFGGIPVKSRTPDEAITLCLDLSQSMNASSAVSDRGPKLLSSGEAFDPEKEAGKVIQEILSGYSKATILDKAKNHLRTQHTSCHQGWHHCIQTDLTPSLLLKHLGVLAYREIIQKKLTEMNLQTPSMFSLACFASASIDQAEDLAEYLEEFLNSSNNQSESIGVEPYDVPKSLIDPTTGDLLPERSQQINERPRLSQIMGIRPKTITTDLVVDWVSGASILATIGDGNSTVTITLHDEGNIVEWQLPFTTPTRVLYKLAHRATRAKFSSFTLRLRQSKLVIPDSVSRTIGLSDLVSGGEIEISRKDPHRRRLQEVNITFRDSGETQKILIPRDTPVLSLLSYVRTPAGTRLSDVRLWHELKSSGDGARFGTMVECYHPIIQYSSSAASPITFECCPWYWISVGPQRNREQSRHLSRLQLLKELFNVFLNRASSFDTSVSLVLGLVTFSDEANIKQHLTPVFESFRIELEKVSARGDTSVYDALDIARGELIKFRQDLPELRRRIIIVSDGEDTSSKATAQSVCYALQRDKIIVDSVQVGKSHNRDLHAFSVATGGYRFYPRTSLADALSIFDLETMLYSAERPAKPREPTVLTSSRMLQFGNTRLYPVDIVTIDKFPQRAEHPKLQGAVRDISRSVDVKNLISDRMKRIMRELKALVADPHPKIDVYVKDEDISFLKVIIEAPDDVEECPYKRGCFLLTCDLPEEYPRDPPEIRFVTFILHPNVSKQGKVCIAELGRLWTSDITLKELFSLVYGLLLEPDLENPLEIQASLKYYDDDGTYALAAAKAVEEHAFKTRAEWALELE